MLSPRMPRALLPVAIAAAALGGVLLVLVTVLLATGHAPGPALAALLNGAAGSWYTFTSTTLLRATPLALTGLAVAVAFRGGVLNIGAEGQLLVGAAAATAVAVAMPAAGPLPPLLAGLLGGVAWTLVPALLKARVGVLEVISTLMANAIAVHLVGWLVRGPLQEPTRVYPQSAVLEPVARLPLLWSGTRLHAGFVLTLLALLVAWWLLTRTAAGFRLRAVGLNPQAAAATGRVDVPRVTLLAFLVSGALAGLAGAVEVLGVTYALYENLSPGYGYTAIAVALLARLDARAILPAALLFAGLQAGGSAMQRDADVPAVTVKVVEAALILGIVTVVAWQQRRRERPTAASPEPAVGSATPARAEATP
jgi:general nucleoside transport system permease protein